jgi:transcriptional regulator with PAS, ATPase and Fis domain
VVSATNKDLKEEIGRGSFRQDLFYRLNTFVIALPPLRQRREDIPLLVHTFLEKLRLKLKLPNLTLTPAALEILNCAHWPGNVRQLEHELERAAVVAGFDQVIDTDDLSFELVAGTESTGDNAKGHLREVVEKLEQSLIAAALREHKGNLVRTSEALGLTRKGLKDKMSRYGMREEPGQ